MLGFVIGLAIALTIGVIVLPKVDAWLWRKGH